MIGHHRVMKVYRVDERDADGRLSAIVTYANAYCTCGEWEGPQRPYYIDSPLDFVGDHVKHESARSHDG